MLLSLELPFLNQTLNLLFMVLEITISDRFFSHKSRILIFELFIFGDFFFILQKSYAYQRRVTKNFHGFQSFFQIVLCTFPVDIITVPLSLVLPTNNNLDYYFYLIIFIFFSNSKMKEKFIFLELSLQQRNQLKNQYPLNRKVTR